MKKIKGLILLSCILFTTACNNTGNEKQNILTTVYPISYITEQIYPQGNVISIYPDGANIKEYNLTEKRSKDYSKNDIFIYNGLSNEQEIAKNLINKNHQMHIIDFAYGLKAENGLEELWLSPNYYLMLTRTIKDNLIKLTESKYVKEDIESRYKKLEETLSLMDAELRDIAKSANEINKGNLVVSSNMLKYLNNYGFNVISLEEKNGNTINVNLIKNNFENGTYSTIFMPNTEEKSELVKQLESSYNAKIVTVNTMTTLTTEAKMNNENYMSIMTDYLENIRNATIGK